MKFIKKYTEGPWEKVEHNWSDTSIYGDSGKTVITTSSIYDVSTEETQCVLESIQSANCDLIAAAPKMIEYIVDRAENLNTWIESAVDREGEKEEFELLLNIIKTAGINIEI